jgi:predicted nuclease of predicted toxin-antitoxin system
VSRLLADENIPLPAVTALRAVGHDVHTIQEQAPGAADADVLAVAREQARILVTFDLDMGQLLFERGLGAPPGVVLIREVAASLAETVELIVALLDRSDITFDGQFTVVSRERIRQRPLPPP